MKLNASTLAVRHGASRDETRTHLNGVRFEETGTIATDGHMLLRMERPAQPVEPFTLERRAADELRKVAKDGAEHVETADGKARFRHGSGTLEGDVIDADFPEWARILDGAREAASPAITLNVALLERVLKAAKEAHPGKRTVALSFRFKDARSPVYFECAPNQDGEQLTGCVMPMVV